MKIINKIREWNTLNKIIVYLLCLPLFYFTGNISIILVASFIKFFINISNKIYLDIIVGGLQTSIILWMVFGIKLFRKNKVEKKKLKQGFLEKSLGEAKSKESPKDRCPKCFALQTKKDSEKGHCWKCDESLEK
jgi:hypothetical protein